jgi:hypothetical protein
MCNVSKAFEEKKFKNYVFFFWVFFEKFVKLPGRSQAVGANCLAAGPSNLK